MSDDQQAPNLHGMTRDELNDHAGGLGIADAADRSVYPTKDDLIAAIEAKQAEAADAEAPSDEAGDGGEESPAPEAGTNAARYRVLKAITDGDGRTWMPGEEIDLSGPEWPARRAKQLEEQKYLRPIGG